MTHPLIDFGGRGATLLLAPANGFPPDAYAALLEPLTERFRVVCLPPRALWPAGGDPPTEPGSWVDLALELLEGMRRHGLDEVIGLGHSFGGVALLVASAREPERFRGLCLLDPTIHTPDFLALLRAGRERILNPLAPKARRRRARFPTMEDAFAAWRDRKLFADWSDEALWRYTRSALRPRRDGPGFELVWSPAWEAYYYESLDERIWLELDRVEPDLPMLLIRGGTSPVFVPAAVDLLRPRLGRVRFDEVPGHGHLFPLTAPEPTRALIDAWLREVLAEPPLRTSPA